jgi:hypothetical protein
VTYANDLFGSRRELDVQPDGNSSPAVLVPEAVYYSVVEKMTLTVRLMSSSRSHCSQWMWVVVVM